MRKNLRSLDRRKRITKNISEAYKKLLLIEEELDRPITVKKKSQNKDITGFDDDKLSAVSMKLISRNEKKQEEIRVLIESGKHFIEEFKNGKDFYKVDDVVVDLTKVINDLKKIDDINPDKLNKVEDMRRVFRYLSTAKQRSDKAIKEIQSKREKAREKFDWSKYDEEYEKMVQQHEEELRQLNQKFGIPDDFEENIDQYVDDPEEIKELQSIQDEYASNAQKMEREAKDTVRYVREILKEYYDLPEKLIEEVTISVRALGTLAKVSKKASSAYIPVDVLKELMKDEKIKKLLDPYVEEKEFGDSVRIIGSKLPSWGTYFGEAENKLTNIIEDIEKTEKSAKKTKKQVSEGVVRDAIINSIKTISSTIKTVYNKVKSVIKSLKNNVYREGSEMEIAIKNFVVKHDKIIQDRNKLYLDLEEQVTSITLDSIKSEKSEV